MKRGTRGVGGVTLVELMIVVAIAGVLAAIAAPSFRTTLPRARLRSASLQLSNDLKLARLKCISGNFQTRIQFNTAASTYTRFLDTNRDGTFAAGEADISGRTMPTGIAFVAGSTDPNVDFRPDGSAVGGSGLTPNITVTLVNDLTPPENKTLNVNRVTGVITVP
jgi:type IV fimbrial biogenesis protein FimT